MTPSITSTSTSRLQVLQASMPLPNTSPDSLSCFVFVRTKTLHWERVCLHVCTRAFHSYKYSTSLRICAHSLLNKNYETPYSTITIRHPSTISRAYHAMQCGSAQIRANDDDDPLGHPVKWSSQDSRSVDFNSDFCSDSRAIKPQIELKASQEPPWQSRIKRHGGNIVCMSFLVIFSTAAPTSLFHCRG
jgi:hypothetical protein